MESSRDMWHPFSPRCLKHRNGDQPAPLRQVLPLGEAHWAGMAWFPPVTKAWVQLQRLGCSKEGGRSRLWAG